MAWGMYEKILLKLVLESWTQFNNLTECLLEWYWLAYGRVSSRGATWQHGVSKILPGDDDYDENDVVDEAWPDTDDGF